MAGRPHSRAQADAAAKRIAEARTLPTQPRTAPVTYHPDLAEEMVTLARVGLDLTEIADHWRISEEALEQMQEAHADIEAAASQARTSCKAWWIRQMRVALASGDNKFAAGSWAQAMRRYPEFSDNSRGVTVNLNLGDLVMMDLRAPEPTRGRLVQGSNPLPHNETVILEGSQTAEGSGELARSEGDDTA